LDPGTGFETHPHEEMEIISLCIEGTLEHVDSMGSKNTLNPGDVQYLCAGSGITHSEMNAAEDGMLRFLQIWISPNKKGLSPYYCSKKFSRNHGNNENQLIVSGEAIDSVIKIQQDINIFVAEIGKQKQITISNRERRQSYLLCIGGNLASNEVDLVSCDALKLWGEEVLTFTALEESQLLMIEMALEAPL
jgi:redox-sensitive bicupin YhaK (pirin superfamily)